MIVVSACFAQETRWIARRPGMAVVHTAMGEGAANDLERRWPNGAGVDVLVATGVCGAADPGLRTGDLILADRILHRGEAIAISPELLDRARGASDGFRVGAAASVDAVAGPEEKRTAREAGATTVDMESGPLARWARQHGVGFVALRAVLDRADESLPFAPNRPIWGGVIRHPIATARLARRAARAGRAIGRGVDAVVEQLQEAGT